MNYLKQSTATTLKLGPFLDETDGKTAETALTIAQADVRVSKVGGNFAQKSDTGTATHDEIGFYDVSINATDTNTVGRLLIAIHESGALPVWAEYFVVPANVYDALVGTDRLEVDTQEMGTDSITAAALSAAAIDEILDEAVDGSYTLRNAAKLIMAVLGSKSSGGGTAILKFRNSGDTADAVTATVDANGNRTAVTLNL